MGKAELPRTTQWQGDLAVVHVSCQHEVERSGREEVEHPGIVAEENPEVGGLVAQPPRLRAAVEIRAWIDADQLHATPAQLDQCASVDEQALRRGLGQPGRVR